MIKNCFHLCTKAWHNSLLCRDKYDSDTLWNAIAICALANGITLYCLCLMSNHIHILLSGTEEQIEAFFRLLKRNIGRYLKGKYPDTAYPVLEYDIFPVSDRKMFCREVAYILRNPYKAGISSPVSYRWNSASAYFPSLPMTGIPLHKIPVLERRSLLHTRLPLPDTLSIADGMITPSSFVDKIYVERMFGTSLIYFNMLKTWNLEDVVNASHGEEVADSYSDEEVIRGIREICTDVFRSSSPERLDTKGLASLVRRVHSRYGCTRKQLMRLLPVDETLLDRIL